MNSLLEQRTWIATIANETYLEQPVVLAGFLRQKRKLGKLCFVVLTDTTGSMQLVFQQELLDQIFQVPKESVICVTGTLKIRKDINPEQQFGQFEVVVKQLTVLNPAQKTPPFTIDEILNVTEDTTLKYRYLFFRTTKAAAHLKARSQIINYLRNFLLTADFTEVNTPILGRSTPEGARDYLVPVRSKTAAKGFALPQSPQLYKQLLMVGGLERYFQFATNFRDEDLRADRQPEFTQLDLEVAYSNTPQFMTLIETMFSDLWAKFFQTKLVTPFVKMSYAECLADYGTDKPDLRFGLKIAHLPNFPATKWNQNQSTQFSHKAIFVPEQNLSRQKLDEIKLMLKNQHQLHYVLIGINLEATPKGDLFKPELVEWTQQYLTAQTLPGTLIVVAGDEPNLTSGMGALRSYLGDLFNLKNPDEFRFLWVTDWPLFEWNPTENKWDSAHNPFTSPTAGSLSTFATQPEQAKADAYDLVLNGLELGSGAKRITDPNLQHQLFNFLGLDQATTEHAFGWFLEAYQYGAPPHQGIGLGIERLLQIMLKTPTIRDVIAFPKNNQGIDTMQNTPSAFSEEQLEILHLTNWKK
ncbi:aspartyl-tRNA synthetase [Mycoplasmoides fastidiosum]|uniref:Aspartate--tRNA ligase n=1 Tax=Mycoplasmoides fastidiosum TaxID=92758 RepID=A0ABU0M077_9BACT|nr:aspartate--tRNA ligase [Mycoplasmoides fastidiosum]MDQ0514349.1 aspartyl-tRNA synthetase [Mycoplasmoides fastidiosum]UUD38050.1 aspartate--tRNA ligase [Mycoplasmoides fastidiosum]